MTACLGNTNKLSKALVNKFPAFDTEMIFAIYRTIRKKTSHRKLPGTTQIKILSYLVKVKIDT